jgi:hypothetical protein
MAVAPKQGWVDLSRSFPIVKVHGTAGKFETPEFLNQPGFLDG